jgi:pimeloyl-ACP methyl ester carboxylesterase
MPYSIDRRSLFLASLPLISGVAQAAKFVRSPSGLPVLPSDTDSAIRNFNVPHFVYSPVGPPRNQLFVFLPGTGRNPPIAARFTTEATNLGYHVVQIAYDHGVGAKHARDDADPDAFARFRWAIIEGGSSPYLSAPISRAESIENRVIKLLTYLDAHQSGQGWGQFLKAGGMNWDKMVLGGHSQGGGHAALMATRYRVARVICTGAPKDYSRSLNAPAKWYANRVTLPQRFFAFNNTHDRAGCTHEELIENLKALGVVQVGGIANVDGNSPPFGHARVLFTSWPGPNATVNSMAAHMSVIEDDLPDNGVALFAPVWRYMLTEPTG